jgi:predicted nuclease of predicted toxin-antitoxin system
VRFVLDQDVDARVATVLRAKGHDAWTVGSAGLARASDDALTVYACQHGAVLLTHDVEFSTRRRKNVIGRHILLRCNEWDGAVVIQQHLDAILPVLGRKPDLWIKLSLGTEPEYSHDWK